MPDQHARLSPSAAERWISCPASVRLAAEAGGSRSSVFAEEGTSAHTIGELLLARAIGAIDPEEFERRAYAWEVAAVAAGFDHREMIEYAEGYRDYVLALAASIPHSTILLEQRVFTGIEGCWGTSDVVIVSPTVILIVDLKYGMGVRVSALQNPQLMLYAVGALDTYGDVLGEVEEVRWAIYQPRLQHTSEASMGAAELRHWRDGVVPIAAAALEGSDQFGPSEKACRWCPVAGTCRARMEKMVQEDFGRSPDLLSLDELGELLGRMADIKAWCQAVETAGLRAAYDDAAEVPGWKVVLSGGRRSITDPAEAVRRFAAAGIAVEDVATTEPKMKSLATLEKLVGKDRLPELLDGVLVKSPGKPSLVPESDSRQAVNPSTSAARDFA